MSEIRAVLFDLDDTLWPVVPTIIRAETQMFDWLTQHAPAVAAQFSIDSLRERRKELLIAHPEYAINLEALRRAGLLEAFTETGENPAKVDEAMAIFIQARNAVAIYEDVLPILDRLRPWVMLGSISNGTADLATIGLADYFQVSIAARYFGKGKPDPAIFQAACDQLGIAPSEAAYIGDDPLLDVAGAQQAGLAGIWINRSGVEPSQVLPDHVYPDAIFTSLFELEQWLKERKAIASKPVCG